MTGDKAKIRHSTVLYEYLAAGLALMAIAVLVALSVWPFGPAPTQQPEEASIWHLLLNDRVVLGFLRAAIVAVAAYVIASVFALGTAARWMKGLGTTGLTADDVGRAEDVIADQRQTIAELDMENQRLLGELDEAYHTLDADELFDGNDEG